MKRAAALAIVAALLLAACKEESPVVLTPEQQKLLASPGIEVNAIVEKVLPEATELLTISEAEVLASGRALTKEEIQLGLDLGVMLPEQVRVATRERFPMPRDPRIGALAAERGLVFGTPEELARTQGHGILLKPEVAQSREVLAHELVHVAQYEKARFIEDFLRRYLIELLTVGYTAAPMEQEARALSAKALKEQ
ncbi:DUF4157 domain-containing protein [Niveibacterium sp. SC-1]|uniref:eCIS core domain-containing protein n=1 Tax=Niveibacterium sp. SC-1 TaxID=3135646 RepID=UPI00311E31F5